MGVEDFLQCLSCGKKLERKSKDFEDVENLVFIICDTGERYLSTELYQF
ncbi:MAG: hypothetical protein ACFFAQ_11440 [Promethearchaeota archaeon]